MVCRINERELGLTGLIYSQLVTQMRSEILHDMQVV